MKHFNEFDKWQNYREGGSPKRTLLIAYLIVLFIMVLFFSKCRPTEEAQVKFHQVEIIKIDTIWRVNGHQQLITLRDKRGTLYSSYSDMDIYWIIGTKFYCFTR